MIDVRNVRKSYGHRQVLADLSLSLHAGEISLLLGANGAGKSTLLRCMLGITGYDGSIRVNGADPLRDGAAVRAQIGYMPQSGGLHPELTVEQTMRLYGEIRGVPAERQADLLEEAGLSPHRAALVGELSGGMRQRLGFAVALLADPSILVLDEPSASLDAPSRRWLARQLRAAADGGRLVLVSTHSTQELFEIGDRRVTLEEGRIISVEAPAPAPATACVARHLSPSRVGARGRILPLVKKELHDAVASRWLLAYTVLLASLGLAATMSGLDGASGLAIQAFGRTTATLMNLCLLLAPLVAALRGAASIAGEQERGTLEHLLALPLTRSRLLLGKHAALIVALTTATFLGFLPAGVLIAAAAGVGFLRSYVLFPAIAALAGAAMAAIGLLISTTSRSAVQAQGAAVFSWFALVLLYDLILMGTLTVSGIPVGWLAGMLVANPIDAARVLGVLALDGDLYLLGPAGAFLSTELSAAGAAAVLLAALAAWTVLPVAAAVVRFSRPLRRSHAHEHTAVHAAGGQRPRQRDCVRVRSGIAGTRG